MRVANVGGRATLVVAGNGIDVERASSGRFRQDPTSLYEEWDEFRKWAETVSEPDFAIEPHTLGAPILTPRQIFAIGLNYRDHAIEADLPLPDSPSVFTKFLSCLAGPFDDVILPTGRVDWEVELVVAIGRAGYKLSETKAWEHAAGVMVGQDLSERDVQRVGAVPQFSLGKSFPTFGPIGPELVTPDELDDPDDLEIGCWLDEETLQLGRTSNLVYSVPELISRLSHVCPLLPGDLIFTGTPAGVGATRNPPRFLSPGPTLISKIEGIGALENRLVGPQPEPA